MIVHIRLRDFSRGRTMTSHGGWGEIELRMNQELNMTSLSSDVELGSLYKIAQIIPYETPLHDYFGSVSAILSESFSITYSALILCEPHKDAVHVEGVYGIGKEHHPDGCSSKKGLICKVLESRKPMAIQNLGQEPLYESVKKTEKIKSPLLCVPLVVDDEAIGVINVTPLYGGKDEFHRDFIFLSILSAILSPVVRTYPRPGRQKVKPSVLEDSLKERLVEVLNRIDPYVESKVRFRLLDDIVTLVEKILITSALEKVEHVQVAAAQLLGINRNTLRKKIKDLKIRSK